MWQGTAGHFASYAIGINTNVWELIRIRITFFLAWLPTEGGIWNEKLASKQQRATHERLQI